MSVKELRESPWCSSFVKLCPKDSGSGHAPYLIRMYQGYVKYHTTVRSRLEEKGATEWDDRMLEGPRKVTLGFENGEAYIENIVKLFDYQAYLDLFVDKVKKAGLRGKLTVNKGKTVTSFYYATKRAAVKAFLRSQQGIPEEESMRGKGEKGKSVKLPVFSMYHLNPKTTNYLHIVSCCLLYTSPSPRDRQKSRMPSSA